ncbi:tumor necrosis factor receptor superfamily member 25 [Rhea pennata]|uniref:tumor necrosis factor receptor superfamily member 25 n=1 Tax=Rhea pennata TaxID=8795 RepID=UPI002E25441F
MKRADAAAAWVLLAALWLAAGGAPGWPRGPAAPSPSPQPPRPRRHAAWAACATGTRWSETAGRCCAECPAGTFLRSPCTRAGNDSVCEPCPAGTFHAWPNTAPECQACYECDRHAFQSVLSNCSATSNVVCSCEPGRFRDCVDERCSDFACRQCRPCAGRLVQRPCSATQDALCGSCKPDFYAEGGECRPCRTHLAETCGEECQRACGGRRGSGLEYILLALSGPLFLGALAIYHKRLRLQQDAGACSPPPATPARGRPESQALLRRCAPERDARPAPAATPLQGSRLYAVIDAVPLRRWKEFVRVLGLRDTEIDVVEVEFAHVRDQQYEMLKRWCQQSSASLDPVFTALERMELAGCAEALRLRLQDCT